MQRRWLQLLRDERFDASIYQIEYENSVVVRIRHEEFVSFAGQSAGLFQIDGSAFALQGVNLVFLRIQSLELGVERICERQGSVRQYLYAKGML